MQRKTTLKRFDIYIYICHILILDIENLILKIFDMNELSKGYYSIENINTTYGLQKE